MNIDIIAIGDELTSGRILNTTSSFAARRLFEAGFDIHAMHTIGDTPQLIGEALHRALDHADAVIVTGGLGMGVDRVVMLITGATIRESLAFPFVRDEK